MSTDSMASANCDKTKPAYWKSFIERFQRIKEKLPSDFDIDLESFCLAKDALYQNLISKPFVLFLSVYYPMPIY